MNVRRPPAIWFALLISGCILSGCGAVDVEPESIADSSSSPTFEPTLTVIIGTVTPAAPSTPAPEPTEEPYIDSDEDSFGLVIETALAEEDSLEAVLMQSPLVVEGVVEEFLPSRWTTPDGARPDHARWVTPDVYSIVTPVVLRLTGEPIINLTGDPVSVDSIIVMKVGGVVGDVSVEVNDPSNYFALDQHVVVAINAEQWRYTSGDGHFPTERGPGWWVSHMWAIAEDGNAASAWSTHPLPELIAGLHAAAASLAP